MTSTKTWQRAAVNKKCTRDFINTLMIRIARVPTPSVFKIDLDLKANSKIIRTAVHEELNLKS